MTDNHDYNTPAKGTQDWDVPLNENFESLDTDVEVRDVEANLGNYTPAAGAKFLATDTENVYVGDGSNWNRLATSGTEPSFDALNPSSNFLGVGRSSRVSDTESFGVDAPVKAGELGGMFVNGFDPDSRPFYGYATDGTEHVAHHYDPSAEQWRLTSQTDLLLAVDHDGDFVGVGRSTPITGAEQFGIRSTRSGFGGMYVDSTDTTGGLPFYGYSIGGTARAYHYYDEEDSEWVLQMLNGSVTVADDGTLSATSKNFVHPVETDEGEREVVYTSVEAGTPTTEASGVVELDDSEAVVDLPEHFAWVTDADEPLMVQVTPHATEPVRPQVVERSTHRIVVRDFEGVDSYEVSYTVRGTREGYADSEVVREPTDRERGSHG